MDNDVYKKRFADHLCHSRESGNPGYGHGFGFTTKSTKNHEEFEIINSSPREIAV